MNIFVLVVIIVLACLGLALWLRKRTKMGYVQKLEDEHNADMYDQQQADFDDFDPERFDPNRKKRRR